MGIGPPPALPCSLVHAPPLLRASRAAACALALVLLAMPSRAQDSREIGLPLVQTFDEGLVATTQVLAIAQGPGGLIYLASPQGLLFYDGVRWDRVDLYGEIPESVALAVGPDGRVWAGARDGIGVFAPDSTGSLAYTSLLDRLPAQTGDLGLVGFVAVTDAGVVFGSDRLLMRWDGKAVQTWPTGPEATVSLDGGTLYIHSPSRGLRRLDGDTIRDVLGGDRFARPGPVAVLSAGSTRIVVTEDGLWRQRGDTFVPFPTAADRYFAENRLYPTDALPLADGRLALATARGGLVILESDGGLWSIVDTNAGLPDLSVYSVLEDRAGGLWVGTHRGVARIAPRHVTLVDARAGLEAMVGHIERHAERLYLATSTGVMRLASPTVPGRPARAVRLPGVAEVCSDLMSTPQDLLVACTSGVYRVSDRVERVAAVDGAYALAQERAGLVWVAARGDGLVALRHDGAAWQADAPIAAAGTGLVSVYAEPDGTVWAGTEGGEVVRVPDAARAPGRVDRWGADDGLGETFWVRSWAVDGEPAFGAMTGLFGIEPDADPALTILPSLGEAMRDAARGYNNVFLMSQGRGGDVWYHGGDDLARARPDGAGGYQIDRTGVQFLSPLGALHALTAEADGTVWIGGTPGLIRVDSDAAPAPTPYAAHIRRVSVVGSDSLLSGGFGRGLLETALGVGVDALRFEYGAASTVGTAPLQFRYRLQPLDDAWSPWSPDAAKEYTNLPPGRYTFEVQAEDAGAQRSEVATLAFELAAPWTATLWARLGLAALALAALAAATAGAVRWRTRRLRAQTQALERAVRERTAEVERQNETLAAQADQLREINQLKSQFFTNVSHEFRTPLTLAIGPLEDLETDALPEPAQTSIALALRNSRRLLHLTNQLLDAARLEAGEVQVRARALDLSHLVRAVALSFASLAERQRIRLSIDTPDEPLAAFVDGEHLETALLNLLSNAFKFTPEGGHIEVEARASGDKLDVCVRDSGAGIAADDLPHVFSRFYRTDESAHRLVGSGIGLALAKDLVELNGGRLSAESIVGLGSVFRIHLPASSDLVLPETSPRRVSGDGVEGTTVPLLEIPEPPTRAASTDAAPADDRTTVLVADDNADLRAYVLSHLTEHYHVLEAADGDEALAIARDRLPDLIVSDVMMPRRSGYELVEALRADPETDFIPVVLLTAKADEPDIRAGLDGGADAYVTKPFNARTLRSRVANLIASRRTLRARFSGLEPTRPSTPPAESAFVARTRAALEAQLDDDAYSVEDLAEAVGVTRSTLHRRLKAEAGETPTTFVRNVRLEHGRELLEASSGSVSEVAYAVGFRSVSHFSRSFRARYDVSPSTVRASGPDA